MSSPSPTPDRGGRIAALRPVITVLAALLVLVPAVAWLAPRADAADPSALAPVPPIDWVACGDETGHDCATYLVPLDHADPSGPQISLALRRLPATGTPDERIGSLFVNPGGPGGSGNDMVRGLGPLVSDDVRRAFDLVGFDPRGVGHSRPAPDCDPGPPPDLSADDWESYFAARRDDVPPSATACALATGRLRDKVGTRQVAADLDLLRRAVGDEELTYWGASYGTRIGYTYAAMFPANVRALVLDGSVDPDSDILTFATERGGSYDDAYQFFRAQLPSSATAIDETLDALGDDGAPVVIADEPRVIDASTFLSEIRGSLSSEEAWPGIVRYITAVHDQVVKELDTPIEPPDDGAVSEPVLEPDPALAPVGHASSGANNFMSVLRNVNCVDLPRPDGSGSPALLGTLATQMEADGPVFGAMMALSLDLCLGFPAVTDPIPTSVPAGLPPILLISSEHDPATPRVWSERMHAAIPGSTLLRYGGAAHGAWNFAGSRCIDDVADQYLLTGDLPATALDCPFVPPAL